VSANSLNSADVKGPSFLWSFAKYHISAIGKPSFRKGLQDAQSGETLMQRKAALSYPSHAELEVQAKAIAAKWGRHAGGHRWPVGQPGWPPDVSTQVAIWKGLARALFIRWPVGHTVCPLMKPDSRASSFMGHISSNNSIGANCPWSRSRAIGGSTQNSRASVGALGGVAGWRGGVLWHHKMRSGNPLRL
jgi:hypothetical protein